MLVLIVKQIFRALERNSVYSNMLSNKEVPTNSLSPHPKEISWCRERELAAPRKSSWAERVSLPWGQFPSSSFGLKDLHLHLLLSRR